MSPRAAWRLDSFGFADVYDYTAGKLDWLAAGLPTEGTNAQHPRAGDIARKEAPTCAPEDRLGEVRERGNGIVHGWPRPRDIADNELGRQADRDLASRRCGCCGDMASTKERSMN